MPTHISALAAGSVGLPVLLWAAPASAQEHCPGSAPAIRATSSPTTPIGRRSALRRSAPSEPQRQSQAPNDPIRRNPPTAAVEPTPARRARPTGPPRNDAYQPRAAAQAYHYPPSPVRTTAARPGRGGYNQPIRRRGRLRAALHAGASRLARTRSPLRPARPIDSTPYDNGNGRGYSSNEILAAGH